MMNEDIDVDKVNDELEEKKDELKFHTDRLKKKPGHEVSKAEAERLGEEIEACKAKLRDARTPTQQMEGKCKRSRKLEDLCEVLGKKMLEEQRCEEQVLAKAEQHAAKNIELLDEWTKNKVEIQRLSLETHNSSNKSTTQGQNQ